MIAITNLEFSSLTEVSGNYGDIQFTMSVKVIGNEEPELYFSDENYYTADGNPRLIQPQIALLLKEALADEIYAATEYETMLREWEIAGYDYADHLNDY